MFMLQEDPDDRKNISDLKDFGRLKGFNFEILLCTELHFSQRKNLKSVFVVIFASLRLEARIEKGQQLKNAC
jgi:hypothetical protein